MPVDSENETLIKMSAILQPLIVVWFPAGH